MLRKEGESESLVLQMNKTLLAGEQVGGGDFIMASAARVLIVSDKVPLRGRISATADKHGFPNEETCACCAVMIRRL